ncbi:MAG: S9 family peptidase [Planctomycetes bacterium]|nr:S9 family peptidase [Planctomycetota bacterium]
MPRVLPRAASAVALFGLIVATAGPLSAQPAATKKVLTFADYDIWRAASGATLSRDGQYVAYLIGREGADGEAVVRHVASGKEYRFARGAVAPVGIGPRFAPDSKRVFVPLSPTKAELEKAKADKLETKDYPKAALAIIDLGTGQEVDRIANVGSYQVAGEGPGFLVYRKGLPPLAPPKKGPPPPPPPPATTATGTDLFIRDLSATVERTIPEVIEFTLTNDEKALVYVVASKTPGKNGVYTMNPRFGTAAAAVKAGPGRYTNLAWDEKQTRLAFYYDDSQVPPANLAPPPKAVGPNPGSIGTGMPSPNAPARWRVFVWDRGTSAPDEVLGATVPALKANWQLTGSGLSFSQDGTKLYLQAAPVRAPLTTGADDIQLDIWHWKDAHLQPAQKINAGRDRSKTYEAVVLLDTKQFRHLSDDAVSVAPPGVGDWGVATDDRKYRHTNGYAWPVPADYSMVNVRTGEAKPLLTASTGGVGLAPFGKFLIGFDGKDWFTVSVPDGKRANLTAKLKEKFFDEEHDTPSDAPPYGLAGWTPDGKFVLVRDRFDIWKMALDGSSAENLTKVGRAQGIRFTVLRPRSAEDRTTERGTDLTKPLLLGAENLTTRDSGFYRLEPGAGPKLLLMGARAYNYVQTQPGFQQVAPVKAHSADAYLLSVQAFTQYPDLYVTAADFHDLRRVTDTNPKVKDYNWGTAELVKYTSTDGTPLQGILVKPENFDPQKKYPMIVYIYERLSENLHQFRVPNVQRGQVINPTFYASNGYLVLMPDIAYTTGAPGPSAMKCVLPAIQAVADKGFVNEKAIGINGQSWGGYQIAYMVTQTNRFKAAVAGAPVANMTSAYSGIRWGSGLPRQFQYEKTQSRIGATLWEAPLKFLENSPVFMADRVQTPLLMIHNDQDDAVPWYQGIEYFLALRRLGKEAYLLNYNGQPHNLTNRNAARDFAMRTFQFYEHHLNGKPAPEWMEKGVPFLDREKEKEQWKKLYGK